MFASKVSHVYKKKYFCSKKLRFEHYFATAKYKIASFTQFILCSNISSKLKKSCAKEAILILQFVKKCSKRNFLEQKYIFFINLFWRFFVHFNYRSILRSLIHWLSQLFDMRLWASNANGSVRTHRKCFVMPSRTKKRKFTI